MGAAGVLIYARLLGRLGWLIRRLEASEVEAPQSEKPKKRRKRKRPEPNPEPQRAADPPSESSKKAMSPWGHEMEDMESYGVASESHPAEPSARPLPRQEDLYTAHEADPDQDASPERNTRPHPPAA